jgi:hypothetical protein
VPALDFQRSSAARQIPRTTQGSVQSESLASADLSPFPLPGKWDGRPAQVTEAKWHDFNSLQANVNGRKIRNQSNISGGFRPEDGANGSVAKFIFGPHAQCIVF